MKRKYLLTICLLVLLGMCAFLPGCKMIDDQQDDCPTEISVTCALDLESNKDQELDDKLGSEHDLPLRLALDDFLTKNIFVKTAHDVDMLFYDQRKRGKMTASQHEVMDATEREYVVRLDASDYRMAGVANLSALPMMTLEDPENTSPVSIVQKNGDKLSSHPTAIFAARQRMLVRDKEGQHYDISYHMANAAAALVLNRDSCMVRSVRAEYGGLADSFKLLDSAYTFDHHTLIEAQQIDVMPYIGSDEDVSYESDIWVYDVFWNRWKQVPLMLCGVGFPSPNVGSEVIGTFPKIWTIYLYVTLASGAVTRTEIYIGKPLQAGHLMIIKGWICGDGSFTATPEHPPYNPSGGPDVPEPPEPPEPEPPASDSTVVGVSVQLNWSQGPEFNPEL